MCSVRAPGPPISLLCFDQTATDCLPEGSQPAAACRETLLLGSVQAPVPLLRLQIACRTLGQTALDCLLDCCVADCLQQQPALELTRSFAAWLIS